MSLAGNAPLRLGAVRGIRLFMFEAVELGRKVGKKEYADRVPELRESILQLQHELRDADDPVVVVLAGVEGAGRGDLINRLAQWLDMRDVEVHAFDRVSDEEASRPEFWRYWRTLPPKGRIGIYLNSWYTDPLFDRALDGGKRGRFERRLARIARFERLLTEDGALLLKFWLHLSRKEQGDRLNALAKDERTKWRVTKARRARHEAYKEVIEAAETAIRLTDTRSTPWTLVEAQSGRYRDLAVAQRLVEALQQRLHPSRSHLPADLSSVESEVSSTHSIASDPQNRSVLDTVHLRAELDDETYDRELEAEQERVAELTRKAHNEGISTVLLFEGWDAAGKGGAIRRVTAAIDARYTRTISIAAPSAAEKAQHYLWRFWRDVPRPGHVTIYDRSWYGRVLVERVEGFAKTHEWMRAYAEINDFEDQLLDHGIVFQKYFIHISPEEQLARFEARKNIPWKRHKITDEDWRNREKWPDYVAAIDEMVARTSTRIAPWCLVAGNDKKHARVTVLRTLRKQLEDRLGA
ncbi:MAG: polyphosphate:AMP phosphotransferase [Myxococcota bacterium]